MVYTLCAGVLVLKQSPDGMAAFLTLHRLLDSATFLTAFAAIITAIAEVRSFDITVSDRLLFLCRALVIPGVNTQKHGGLGFSASQAASIDGWQLMVSSVCAGSGHIWHQDAPPSCKAAFNSLHRFLSGAIPHAAVTAGLPILSRSNRTPRVCRLLGLSRVRSDHQVVGRTLHCISGSSAQA